MNSIVKTGVATTALASVLLLYSGFGPSEIPAVPPLSEGAQFNQQYQREMREFPAKVARHEKAGWFGDRMLVVGGILILAGLLIPLSQQRRDSE